MIDETDWARLARHLAGEETPDEAAATRAWIESDAERRAVAASIGNAWRAAATPPPRAWDSAAAWKRLNAKALSSGGRVPTPVKPRRGHWGRVLAIGLTAAAAALAFSLVRQDDVPTVAPPRAASLDREFRTAPGQRAVVNLGDGTRVELGVASLLRVSGTSGARREVFLDGEAAFTVVHDTTRPFLVHARNAVAEDLGTRFGVRAYTDDPAVRVFVASGEVALADTGHTTRTVLLPGDQAALDVTGRVALEHGADTSAMLAWTRDRFVVRDAPLRDVARQLARWFDVDIQIRDSAAAARRVTIDMPAIRLTDILGAATTPLGLIYSQRGRDVVIRRPAANPDSDSLTSRRSEP